MNQLDDWTQKGMISVYMKKTILETSGKVLENIAQWYNNVREGAIKKAKETAWNLRALGMDDNAIADAVNVQVALVKEWFAERGI